MTYDIFIIGGGINGTGIARDAAGRGLSVALAEMDDLGHATSSSSTKLFHGGLRYLEFFEVGLVKKALIEREVLLSAMPHISWPMRFVLPVHKDMRFESDTPASKVLRVFMPWMKGRRPAWMIRLGLFFYDHLGGRKVLPATRSVNLREDPVGAPLQSKFSKAFEYSDCWVEDSRLVVLNARDAVARGADVWTRTKVVSADQVDGLWHISLEHNGEMRTVSAKTLVNAGGPWVEDVIRNKTSVKAKEGVRLVRGSHIVTRKLFDHEKAYFFQGEDGRIIFAIPYEGEFTLIGTTDLDHGDDPTNPECSPEEQEYLCAFASNYFENPVTLQDIVWTFSGVRPLYDDGAETATAATRDYVLSLHHAGAPLLNIFGGKITTYRKLAENALAKLAPFHPQMAPDWTAGVAMPGGDFAVDEVETLIAKLQADYAFLSNPWARRMVRAYGLDAWDVLGAAKSKADLGQDFGATLSEAEVRWLQKHEFAQTAQDILWRRSKLGLHMSDAQKAQLDAFLTSAT